MTSSSVTIIHVDDEPEKASWIPDALSNAYYRRHPLLDITLDGWDEQVDQAPQRQTFSFCLQAPCGTDQDRHLTHILVNHEQHLTPEDWAKVTLLILDVFRPDDDQGKIAPFSHLVYAQAIAHGVPPAHIFLLTAYGDRINREAFPGIPPANIFTKPTDPTSFAETLLSALGVPHAGT